MQAKATKIFRHLASFSTPTSACIVRNCQQSDSYVVHSSWKQRDLERLENVTFSQDYLVNNSKVITLPIVDSSNELLRCFSHSGKYCAVLRNVTQKKGETKQFLEIWDSRHKLHNYDVSLMENGEINCDTHFKSLEWSSSERKLLYVAEKKVPKNKNFFEKVTDKEADSDSKTTVGEEFIFRENWGETLTKVCQPVICVLDLDSDEVTVLSTESFDISPGQAKWCKDDSGVLFAGWNNQPYKPGLRFCDNRISNLYYINLETKKCEKLTSDTHSLISPVFDPQFTSVYFLQSEIYLAHQQSKKLMRLDWNTRDISTVVDINQSSHDTPDICGMMNVLNSNSWSKDGKQLLINTIFKGKQTIISIDVDSGKLKTLKFKDDNYGSEVLDVFNDIVVAMRCSLNIPPYLVTFTLPPFGEDLSDVCQLTAINTIGGVSWSEFYMDSSFGGRPYQCILIEPTEFKGDKPPLAVYNHGGPHSTFTTSWAGISFAGICMSGFAVLLVNYHGSIGFGQDDLEILLGKVGTCDVQEVQSAVEHVLTNKKSADRNRVVVIGGSHGGFLTAHLIGQYPDFYKAAVTRNAVINIGSMAASTDISDWCWEEVGLPYNLKNVVDPDTYKKMWEASPIRYVDQVKTPILLLIGEDDRRVPSKQNHEYRKALQARGVEVKVLSYPTEGHALYKVETETDDFVHILNWFEQHI